MHAMHDDGVGGRLVAAACTLQAALQVAYGPQAPGMEAIESRRQAASAARP